MLTEDIHRRIMLNELREILVDPNRPNGGHLPSKFVNALDLDCGYPYVPFLAAADWLAEQSNTELENLIRTHCELIDLMPMDGCLNSSYTDCDAWMQYEEGYWAYPMRDDLWWGGETKGYGRELIESRLLSYKKMYGFDTSAPNLDCQYSQRNVTAKLGRTTRMLTDVIRRCGLENGLGPRLFQAATVVINSGIAATTGFEILARAMIGDEKSVQSDRTRTYVWGKPVAFISPTNSTRCHQVVCRISDRDIGSNGPLGYSIERFLLDANFQTGIGYSSERDDRDRCMVFTQQRQATYTATDHRVIEQRRNENYQQIIDSANVPLSQLT